MTGEYLHMQSTLKTLALFGQRKCNEYDSLIILFL